MDGIIPRPTEVANRQSAEDHRISDQSLQYDRVGSAAEATPPVGHHGLKDNRTYDALLRISVDWLVAGVRGPCPRWSDRGSTTTPEVARLVAESWTSAVLAAAARGRALFAGPMARLRGWSADDGTLTLDLGPTDYRQFVGPNLRHPELARQYGRKVLANPLGVSVAVVTADGRFVVQRRSEHVFEYPGYFHVCGGNVEPVDVDGPDAPGVFAAARRELEEELGIVDAQIVDFTCLGLAENSATLKPDLLFATGVALTADALVTTRHAEYSDLAFIDGESALGEHLTANNHVYSPPGMACLLATGRRMYGDGWFQSVLRHDES